MKLPSTILIVMTRIETMMTCPQDGAKTMAAKRVVMAHEMIEPKFGMKFSTKARNPQTTGKSMRAMRVVSPTRMPVISETKNLIER